MANRIARREGRGAAGSAGGGLKCNLSIKLLNSIKEMRESQLSHGDRASQFCYQNLPHHLANALFYPPYGVEKGKDPKNLEIKLSIRFMIFKYLI